MAANHYNSTAQNGNSSASIQEPDEMSLFLQQIFLRSASSSSLSDKMRHRSFFALSNHILDGNGGPGTGMGQIHVPDHHPPLLDSSSGFSFTAANLPSPSAGKLDSEADEYEYESEDVIEAVVEETLPKRVSQSSSKRSRAAEVHNLSEKRRRSRINEKMKALQNLIPNSNKTDKASMLDEAIEYLKQLQLQVQMLTMRNGLSLYPNQMPHMRLDTHDPDNLSKSILMDRHMPEDVLLSAHDKCVKPRPVTDFSCAIDSKASFRMPSPHFGTYQHLRPYEGICEAKPRLAMPMDDDRRRSNLSGSEVTSLLPPESNPCIREARGDDIVQNFVDHPIFSSQSNM